MKGELQMKTRKNNFRILDPAYQKKLNKEKKKKRFEWIQTKSVAILTALAITACGGGTYLTKAADYTEAYVDVETVLNFRTEPSMEGEIIDQLSPYTLVDILSEDVDGWTYIQYHGQKGYVATRYLTIARYGNGYLDENEEIEKMNYELIAEAEITAPKSSENRNFNMARACEKIDGLELYPGDVFAWYDVDKDYDIGHIKSKGKVGPASKENGYKQANIISGGKYVKGYGGGVCQVSTALYNCIYKLDITPIEHHHHTLASSYVEEGMDATVAYSDDQTNRKNFVFANMEDYGIRFMAYTSGSTVVVKAYKIEKDE